MFEKQKAPGTQKAKSRKQKATGTQKAKSKTQKAKSKKQKAKSKKQKAKSRKQKAKSKKQKQKAPGRGRRRRSRQTGLHGGSTRSSAKISRLGSHKGLNPPTSDLGKGQHPLRPG